MSATPGDQPTAEEPVSAEEYLCRVVELLNYQDGTPPTGGAPFESFESVYRSQDTLVLRRGDLGMKVMINREFSQEKVLAMLEHERRVSNYLPPAVPHRKVGHLDVYQGCFGFRFDWVEGVTVAAWLNSIEQQEANLEGFDGGDLMNRLRVAIAVVEAVSSLHEAGVAHTSIGADNIILSFDSETHCSATLIDLVNAAILSDEHISGMQEAREAFTARMKNNDLKSLGCILYSILGGKEMSAETPESQDSGQEEEEESEGEDEEFDQSARFKRGRTIEGQNLTHNMPFYLTSIVSWLIAPTINERGETRYQYKSAKDVLRDLQGAHKKPEIYLRCNDASEMINRTLHSPMNSFYGRLSELAMIQQSLAIVMNSDGQPVVVTVSGHAGAGKTTLLNQVVKPIAKSNGFVIRCNFDRTASPDTVLARAFNNFFGNVLNSEDQSVQESIRNNISKNLGQHIKALQHSIPSLRAFMHGVSSVSSPPDEESDISKQQLKFLLTKLVYAISEESRPIAIIAEDLHWSDKDARDTLRTMMMDRAIRYCLYYVSYRDDDAAVTHGITQMIDAVQAQGLAAFNMKLGPIDKRTVDTLVSETLCMPPSLSQSLSSLIHTKTGGIILFVQNFLESLLEQNLVRFSLSACRWDFDFYTIRDQQIPGDIIKYLSERMRRLPKSVQLGLQVAACLGSSFDTATLKKAHPSSSFELDDFLTTVTEGGFLVQDGFTQEEQSSTTCKWSHDQINQAAYSLIPTEKRESFHLLIGTRLFLNTDASELHENILNIVRNMNIGVDFLTGRDQKIELARLNLLAGERSSRQSAFNSAEGYFQSGISLLDHDWISSTYDLAMKLFRAALQAAAITGNAKNFKATINQPLLFASCFEDRLPAYYSLVRFLAVSGHEDEAFQKCLSILSDSGEVFPDEATPQIIYREVLRTKAVLNQYSKDDFLSLPRLDVNSTKYWQVKMWKLAMVLSFHLNNQFAPLIGARIVQISSESGWCDDSAFGLYSYGHSLICVMEDVEEGYFWSKMAVTLVQQFNQSGKHLAVLKTLHHGFVSFWKEPIQSVAAVLMETEQEALMEGQTEFSMSCALNYCRQDFMSGANLVMASEICKSCARKMAQQNQVWSSMLFISHHVMVLKLIDIDESSPFATLPGNISNEDELLEVATSRRQKNLKDVIFFYRALTAFWFRKYDEAARYPSGRVIKFLDIYHVFYEGLSALHLARKKGSDEKKWTDIGEKAVQLFQKWEGYSNWNFENKLWLLQAELHYLRGEVVEAEEKYKASILSAVKHHFTHEEGLGMERLGLFYLTHGTKELAKVHLLGAYNCFTQWGAVALLPFLDEHLSQL